MFVVFTLPRLIAWLGGFQYNDSTWGTVSFAGAFFIFNGLYLLVAVSALSIVGHFNRAAAALFAVWLAGDFWIRALETALMHYFDLGFGPEFFFYLGWDAVILTVKSFPLLLLLVVAASGGLCVAGLRLYQAIRLPLQSGIAVCVMATLTWFAGAQFIPNTKNVVAIHAFVKAALNQLDQDVVLEPALTDEELRQLAERGISEEILLNQQAQGMRPNVLLVFVESLQLNLTSLVNPALSHLTPNLEHLARNGRWYTNFYSTADDTVLGLFSGLCGVLPLPDLLFVASVKDERVRCLPDDLRSLGYRTSFMMGGSYRFGSKGAMLRRSGFESVSGREESLKKRPDLISNLNPWGLHDTDLVREFLDRLDAGVSEPFFTAMLTVNGHVPGFTAPDCPHFSDDRLLQGIYCTDVAIGILLQGLRSRGFLERTVVLVVADHHYHSSATSQARYVAQTPNVEAESRRIFAALLSPGQQPMVDEDLRYLADVPAIVLEQVGVNVGRYRAGVGEQGVRLRRSIITSDFAIQRSGAALVDTACSNDAAHQVLDARVLWTSCARRRALLHHNLGLLPH